MKIETKFNIGDTIFFLHENRVLESIIRSIKIDVKEPDDFNIIYVCNKDEDSVVGIKVNEGIVFGSKKQLLSSL